MNDEEHDRLGRMTSDKRKRQMEQDRIAALGSRIEIGDHTVIDGNDLTDRLTHAACDAAAAAAQREFDELHRAAREAIARTGDNPSTTTGGIKNQLDRLVIRLVHAEKQRDRWKRIALMAGITELDNGEVLVPHDEGLTRRRWWWPW